MCPRTRTGQGISDQGPADAGSSETWADNARSTSSAAARSTRLVAFDGSCGSNGHNRDFFLPRHPSLRDTEENRIATTDRAPQVAAPAQHLVCRQLQWPRAVL